MADESLDHVRRYYSRFREWSRLGSAAGRLEFLRTTRIIEDSVTPPASVLDLGGGPGRYTIHLARAGYRPTLADLSPRLVQEAKRRVARARCADGVDGFHVVDGHTLSRFGDATFDAVLAFGPYYHLVDAERRDRLAREILRVARPGAWLAVAFIPRLAGVRGLIGRAAGLGHQVTTGGFTEALATGRFRNGERYGFQEGWFAEPDEIRALFDEAGATTERMVSVKGLASGQEAALLRLRRRSPELFDDALTALEETSERPEIVATADHALWIGRA